MSNITKNEGMWDRLSAGWSGVKTGASNIGATVAGTPSKVTSVQDSKIKQLFQLAQSRMKPFVRNLGSQYIISKTNAEIEVKKQLLGFLQDFMKMTGEKNPNNVIVTLQQPQYKNISDFLGKIGVVSSSSKTPASKTPISKKPAPKPAPKAVSPKPGQKYNNKTYDGATKLWVNDATGKPLSGPASQAVTIGFQNAVKSGKVIPESVTKITYKEFFVE